MNIDERNELIKNFFMTRCWGILESKGRASTGGTDDGNKNFKEAQLEGKCDDVDAWWIYYIKHVIRLKNFVTTRKMIGEKIEETIADLVNYPLILYTILIEKGILKNPNVKKKLKK